MKKNLLCALAAAGVSVSLGHASEWDRIPRTGAIQASSGENIEALPVGGAGFAVASSGVLNRHIDGVTFDGTFRNLRRNGVYTLWWVVFNNPKQCGEPGACIAPDVFTGAGQVFYAGAFLTDDGTAQTIDDKAPPAIPGQSPVTAAPVLDGQGDANVTLRRGSIPAGATRFSEVSEAVFGIPIDPATERGLRRPFAAQIEVVARYHGPIDFANPETVGQEIGDYLSGCGPNGQGCFDEQVIRFNAVTSRRGEYVFPDEAD
ncbi:MAG: hypothetical protein AAFX08_05970 [Pseudomonadota bacterium]